MSGYEHQDSLSQLQLPSMCSFSRWGEEMLFIDSACDQAKPPCLEREEIESQHLDSCWDDNSAHKTPSSEGTLDKDSASLSPAADKVKFMERSTKKKGGCNCKKSQCLKSYCECYSTKGYCSAECSCLDCKNNQQHVQLIEELKRQKSGHNRNRVHCQCKKSRCQKKYCECFSAGLQCTQYCKCLGCQNCSSLPGESKQPGHVEMEIFQEIQVNGH